MREINITSDVIEFLRKSLSRGLSTEAILKGMSMKGWQYSCNNWEGFVSLLEKGNLDKIFLDFEFYIRY